MKTEVSLSGRVSIRLSPWQLSALLLDSIFLKFTLQTELLLSNGWKIIGPSQFLVSSKMVAVGIFMSIDIATTTTS